MATQSLNFSKSCANVFIIAVKDDAIKSVIKELIIPENSILVHTSGAILIDVLKEKTTNYGIFYPLQTFTKGREINFYEVPILLEASNKFTQYKLTFLAQLISKKVCFYNSTQRASIHLAAVFASNFTTKLLDISNSILTTKEIDFTILKPLVEETIKKTFDIGAKKAQTGPAIRNDEDTITKHLELISDNLEYKELYTLITQLIKNRS